MIKEYSHNGIKYYADIDIAIVNQLSNCESVYSSELRRTIEESLGRKVPFSTFSIHIKRMLKENILQKNDTLQRGKKSVSYAMTEVARKLNQLRLLRTDPQYDQFKKIYAYLLSCSIEHPSFLCKASIGTMDLDKLLSDIDATRNDLNIESVRKCKKEYFFDATSDPDMKPLPYSVVIEYQPVSAVRISKVINYSLNCKQNKYKISSMYYYILPGFSPEDLNFSIAFHPNPEDLQEAFSLLRKYGLIRPMMIFQKAIRYTWTDERLNDLMQNLRLLHELEGASFSFRSFHNKPTYEEQERLEFFENKLTSRTYLKMTELARFELKTKMKVQKRKRYKQRLLERK